MFENRGSTEKDLNKCHALVLYVLKIKVARQKLRHLSENVKTSMDSAVEFNEETIRLAGKDKKLENTYPNKVFGFANNRD